MHTRVDGATDADADTDTSAVIVTERRGDRREYFN